MVKTPVEIRVAVGWGKLGVDVTVGDNSRVAMIPWVGVASA